MDTLKIAVPIAQVAVGHKGLQQAATWLRAGKLVAFPTETVYGLGADARQDEAVARIFTAKDRPQDNPLIVHVADRRQLEEWTESIPTVAEQLMQRFWPGPLSIVLSVKKGVLSEVVTAGLPTVAVRMPDHPTALELIRAANIPIAAPSANRSGRPSPTQADHVLEDLSGRIAAVVDSGPTGIGLESTVVTVDHGRVQILRPGGISVHELRAAGFIVDDDCFDDQSETSLAPQSPGVKYTHYAPKGRLLLVQGADIATSTRQKVQRHVQAQIEMNRTLRTAVLTYDEHVASYQADLVISLGSIDDMDQWAKTLYAALRTCDAEQIEWIVAEFYPRTDGLGLALSNRLLKAAGYNRIIVS